MSFVWEYQQFYFTVCSLKIHLIRQCNENVCIFLLQLTLSEYIKTWKRIMTLLLFPEFRSVLILVWYLFPCPSLCLHRFSVAKWIKTQGISSDLKADSSSRKLRFRSMLCDKAVRLWFHHSDHTQWSFSTDHWELVKVWRTLNSEST